MTTLHLLFVLAAVWLTYCYLAYPGVMMLTSRLRPRETRVDEHFEPSVALIISAFNERESIRQKLENALSLDYPRHRLSVWVSSDGSSDGTNEICRKIAELDARVVLVAHPTNRGKTAALMDTLSRIPQSVEVIVFSDANSLYRPDALRRLVRHLADPDVGCVAGDLRYVTRGGESNYRSFENALRFAESRLGYCVGAEGSIYAARRPLIPRIDTSLLDDLTIPLLIQAGGHRVIYAPDAVSEEEFALGWRQQYRRRRRIVNRAFRSARTIPNIWNPFRYGGPALVFLSHRVLRWTAALPLAVLLASGISLLWIPGLPRLMGGACAVFLLWAIAGYAARDSEVGMPGLKSAFFFCLANLAMIDGITSALRGEKIVSWAPARTVEQ